MSLGASRAAPSGELSADGNTVHPSFPAASSYVWLLNTWNVPLNFNLWLIYINLNLNSHRWLVTTVLGSTGDRIRVRNLYSSKG